mmetsp:Transcript_35361/g.99677  ORF Transcript_35361/g.99677 Transcript_35361/m.99677 type:complete len:100 (-) Transcript_35361:1422-1721(-)
MVVKRDSRTGCASEGMAGKLNTFSMIEERKTSPLDTAEAFHTKPGPFLSFGYLYLVIKWWVLSVTAVWRVAFSGKALLHNYFNYFSVLTVLFNSSFCNL